MLFKWPGLGLSFQKMKLLGQKWLPNNLTYRKKHLSFYFKLFGAWGVLLKKI